MLLAGRWQVIAKVRATVVWAQGAKMGDCGMMGLAVKVGGEMRKGVTRRVVSPMTLA